MEEIIFPNQIRMQRRLKGMSMQELADGLGISKSCLSHRIRKLLQLAEKEEE